MTELRSRKRRNVFYLTLGPYYSADPNTGERKLVYGGCSEKEQYAFSHEQAIASVLAKADMLGLADEYIMALKNRRPEANVVLDYKGRKIDMTGYPSLEEMRNVVAKKSGASAPRVRRMAFGDLVVAYDSATRVPSLSEILAAGEKGVSQYELFPDYEKRQREMERIRN